MSFESNWFRGIVPQEQRPPSYLDALKFTGVYDLRTSVSLRPFISDEPQVQRAVTLESELTPHEAAMFLPAGRQSIEYAEVYYSGIGISQSRATFEIVTAAGVPVGLVSCFNFHEQHKYADTSVILSASERGKGLAYISMAILYARMKQMGIMHAGAVISARNTASRQLHLRFPARLVTPALSPEWERYETNLQEWNEQNVVELGT